MYYKHIQGFVAKAVYRQSVSNTYSVVIPGYRLQLISVEQEDY